MLVTVKTKQSLHEQMSSLFCDTRWDTVLTLLWSVAHIPANTSSKLLNYYRFVRFAQKWIMIIFAKKCRLDYFSAASIPSNYTDAINYQILTLCTIFNLIWVMWNVLYSVLLTEYHFHIYYNLSNRFQFLQYFWKIRYKNILLKICSQIFNRYIFWNPSRENTFVENPFILFSTNPPLTA